VDEKLYHLTPKQREAIVSRLTEILQQEPTVLGAWLHGSFHEGLPFHDIDVAVYLDPDSGAARDPLTLMPELGDRLERAVRLPVDVRVLNGAPLSLKIISTSWADFNDPAVFSPMWELLTARMRSTVLR